MTDTSSEYSDSRWRRACGRAASACLAVADAAGHVAAAILVLLSASIILGIVLRWIGINNTWTYDLDLFTLVWLAFVGAVYTSLTGHHVTAGIALENMLGGRGTVLACIRVVIIVGFLILFTASGFHDTQISVVTQETTLDLFRWPVWVAKVSLPIGSALWAVAEIGKFLRKISDTSEQGRATSQPEDATQ